MNTAKEIMSSVQVIDSEALDVTHVEVGATGAVVVADALGRVRVWADGAAIDLPFELEVVYGVAAHPLRTELLVAGRRDGAALVKWNWRSGDVTTLVDASRGHDVTAVAYGTGRYDVLAAIDRALVRLGPDGRELERWDGGERHGGIAFSPARDAFVLAAASQGRSHLMWFDVGPRGITRRPERDLGVAADDLGRPCFSTDGASIVVPARHLLCFDVATRALRWGLDENGLRTPLSLLDAWAPVTAPWSGPVAAGVDAVYAAPPGAPLRRWSIEDGSPSDPLCGAVSAFAVEHEQIVAALFTEELVRIPR